MPRLDTTPVIPFSLARISARRRLSARVLARIAETLSEWRHRRRSRRALARLEPHMLRDIGLDPSAAAHEARLPFWRASPPYLDHGSARPPL